jgi:hypothetical protein
MANLDYTNGVFIGSHGRQLTGGICFDGQPVWIADKASKNVLRCKKPSRSCP